MTTVPRLLSASDVGAQLGVTPKSVLRWAEAGLISSVKVGRRRKFRQADVDEYVERNRKASTTGGA